MIGIVLHNISVESGWALIKQILSSRLANNFWKRNMANDDNLHFMQIKGYKKTIKT